MRRSRQATSGVEDIYLFFREIVGVLTRMEDREWRRQWRRDACKKGRYYDEEA